MIMAFVLQFVFAGEPLIDESRRCTSLRLHRVSLKLTQVRKLGQ